MQNQPFFDVALELNTASDNSESVFVEDLIIADDVVPSMQREMIVDLFPARGERGQIVGW